ncbi:unnamed protein product [Mytilus edulis]|uniref:Short-chain collagen C4-like n=1 Tax=Mytilus edulis TaxID=6550 RepID=A0A8S3SQB7_MYTED|nr:unnamed protein product [Mytilus edulis]
MARVTSLVLLFLFIGSCQCDWWTDYLSNLVNKGREPTWAPDYLDKQLKKDTQNAALIKAIQDALNETNSRNNKRDRIITLTTDLHRFKLLDELYEKVEGGQGKAGSGNTYTRWGKTSCPSTAALVYEGYAAGNAKYEKGGGANFLCLPKDPEWRSYSDSKATYIGRVFGVEYQIKDNSVYSTSFHDKEMPCSVCLITEKSTSLMVPGKVTCPTGWTKEYTGYLMSQAIAGNRQPSEYICVDENLDAVDGNKADNDQGNVYLVEGVCGSLKCPPYVGGRELTCVVCSK